jgi:hypothetical protein
MQMQHVVLLLRCVERWMALGRSWLLLLLVYLQLTVVRLS